MYIQLGANARLSSVKLQTEGYNTVLVLIKNNIYRGYHLDSVILCVFHRFQYRKIKCNVVCNSIPTFQFNFAKRTDDDEKKN